MGWMGEAGAYSPDWTWLVSKKTCHLVYLCGNTTKNEK